MGMPYSPHLIIIITNNYHLLCMTNTDTFSMPLVPGGRVEKPVIW